MSAILSAIKQAAQSDNNSIIIRTDSLSSLKLLEDPDCVHPIGVKIQKKLYELHNKTIKFEHVKAHNGDIGNEIVDSLAKSATSKELPEKYDKMSINSIKNHLKKKYHKLAGRKRG